MAQATTIDRLLNLAPDRPDAVLQHLAGQPDLASQQDFSGYSLLHAAVSYGHVVLVRRLITDYGVDVNIRDHDGDTPLCVSETVDMARLLVEELGADIHSRNHEDETPEDKIESEEEFPLVAAYLREAVSSRSGGGASSTAANGIHPQPSRVPPGIGDIRIGTTTEPVEDGSAPNPEFRRRIEELASRPDFQSEQGQADLRDLVQEVVTGMREDRPQERATRPRTD